MCEGTARAHCETRGLRRGLMGWFLILLKALFGDLRASILVQEIALWCLRHHPDGDTVLKHKMLTYRIAFVCSTCWMSSFACC